MVARDAHVPIEDLLSHRSWVRGLAMAITRDPDAVDDIEQQTWLSALRSPPGDARSPRGWLSAVVRNVVRQGRRSGTRRRRREWAVARTERCGGEDPAELTARAELHASVAAAVVALKEPYRRAILLRHFEDLPVAEVAQRMGTPLETARARLRRGRAMLRERLAADVGDGRPLAIVLLPLIRTESLAGGAALAAAGGAIFMTKTWLAVAAVAVLALILWSMDPLSYRDGAPGGGGAPEWLPGPEEEPLEAGRAGIDPRSARTGGTDAEPDEREGRGEDGLAAADARPRATVRGPSVGERLAQPIAEIVLEDVPLREILGRIAWCADVPIVIDLRVVHVVEEMWSSMNSQMAPGDEVLALCADLAGLEVTIQDKRAVLHRGDDDWSDEFAVQRIEPNPAPAPREPVRLTGRIVGPDGLPVPRANVWGLANDLVRADVDGRFACSVPHKLRYVQARAPGFTPSDVLRLAPPFDQGAELRIVLGVSATPLAVRVIGAGGRPVVGAVVHAATANGDTAVLVTGGDGKVAFDETPAGKITVSVDAKGYAPESRRVDAVGGETTKVEFELTLRTLAERLLSERTSFSIEKEPFERFVATLRRRWQMDVRASAELPAAVAAKRLTLTVVDDTVENALRALCDEAGATYRVDSAKQVLWIEAAR